MINGVFGGPQGRKKTFFRQAKKYLQWMLDEWDLHVLALKVTNLIPTLFIWM